jgi:hypothetical protein
MTLASLWRRSISFLVFRHTGLVMQRTIRIIAQRGLDDEDQNPVHPITTPIWWRAQPPAMPRVRAQASWMKPTISCIRASSWHVLVSRQVSILFYDDGGFVRNIGAGGTTMGEKITGGRPWTKEELRMLKTLAGQQTKTTVIARKLKRSVAAVYLRASKLAVMLGGGRPVC